VEFAGISEFLDTPVKRYSSGMYARLGFAVAAHLDPEILIVDEVLAVGDSEFQRKCLGKMARVASQGRTVLFVSHNMAAVQSLCTKAILLEKGEVCFTGNTSATIQQYLRTDCIDANATIDLVDHGCRRDGSVPMLKSVRILDNKGVATNCILAGDSLTIEFDVDPSERLESPTRGVGVEDAYGTRLFTVATQFSSCEIPACDKRCTISCHIESVPLIPGQYFLSFSAGCLKKRTIDFIDHAATLDVESSDFLGVSKPMPLSLGYTLVRSQWIKRGS